MTAAPMDLQGAAPPLVAYDRFPVTVTTPTGSGLHEARMILTVPADDAPGRLLVWLHTGDPMVDTTWDPAESTIVSPLVEWIIATPDGPYRIERGRGCGCGNRLKGWLPWTPYTMGQLP